MRAPRQRAQASSTSRRATTADGHARGRAALRDAALAAFAARGFEGASTREIAQRAGVPQGLIRYHFGAKEQLWRELVRDGLRELASALVAQPSAPAEATTPGDRLLAALWSECQLVQLVCHALLEPGPRRDWLLGELGALRAFGAELAAALEARDAGRIRSEHAVAGLMWCAAAAAAPLFAPVLALLGGETLPRQRATQLQRELLDLWLSGARVAFPAGPWSLAAAARRRVSEQAG